MEVPTQCPCCRDEIATVVPHQDGRWKCPVCGCRGIVGNDGSLVRQQKCPVCDSPINTSNATVTFWRCPTCFEAIVRRSGRLQRWLDYTTAGRKSKRVRRDVRGSQR